MNYFFIYYMNLMFSALSPHEQKVVIDKCLDPLLELAEKGCRFGLQISGVSLEIINEYRPDLVIKIKNLILSQKIEFIGNGYGQIIQPLFPHDLNLQNQLIGKEVYQSLFDITPEICTINEMAYSKGSCESIQEAGYKTILMEWNNASSIMGSNYPDQFSLSKTIIGNSEMDILWCDTVAFQKFQKYVHGEISLECYFEWLNSYTLDLTGALCLYCSDAEIFGFRPNRYGTEATPTLDEWKRIELLMKRVQDSTVLPSKVQATKKEIIEITNAEHPIVVKKQHKYNINRWALSGRDDQLINTFCYKLLNIARNNTRLFSKEDWKNLLKVASSDLRTHIEESRWNSSQNIIKEFQEKFENELNSLKNYEYEGLESQLLHEFISIDRKRGNNIINWPLKDPMIGKVDLGRYSKINLMADFYSGYALIEKLGYRKISDLDYEASSINSSTFNEFSNNIGYVIKKNILSANNSKVNLLTEIKTPARFREQIKINNFAFTSENWDIDRLYYKCNLGGNTEEKFYFGESSFNQDRILNLNVIGVNGFALTNNMLTIGDENKEITFLTNSATCFNIVRFTYEVDHDGQFLLQLAFIVQDIDETFVEDTRKGHFLFPLEIHARNF